MSEASQASIVIDINEEGVVKIDLFGTEGTEAAKSAATILKVWDSFQTSDVATMKEPSKIILPPQGIVK